MTLDPFALPDTLAAKRRPELIGADAQFLARLATALDSELADLGTRLDLARRAPGGEGEHALNRDLEIHRLAALQRTLRRFGMDLCLGRMVPADGSPPVYVGRLGLADGTGEPLLVDWRTPAAEPFFGATHADPRGLASRRRYRWTDGRITDYWDEVFTADALPGAAPDDHSAFVASLGSSRTPRMRDVLGTIATDQDAIIRAEARGALVVDGGPGTGKTVVALHRAAYLLHADPRLARRGGVLVVGPHQPYLDYVADVLPGLGEDGVRTCTLRDLVAEGAVANAETDPGVAELKASARMVGAVEAAVALYEQPPSVSLSLETDWGEVIVSPGDWAEAFGAVEPDVPHNEARQRVWAALLDTLADGGEQLRAALARHRDLLVTFHRAWPTLDPATIVEDLWSVPAYLARCAPWLSPAEVARLQRDEPRAWTEADLPLLDAAHRRVGDPRAARRERETRAAVAADRRRMDDVVAELVAADIHGEGLGRSLQQFGLRQALEDVDPHSTATPDLLAGPFAHVVVDEAQELTDAQWQMIIARCPTGSLTIVGDRAQARAGFAESWRERLERVGIGQVRHRQLHVNYRTPAEVMREAEPAIRAVLPDANVPTSVRRSGQPVRHGSVADLEAVVAQWQAAHADGVGCVIGAPDFEPTRRVRSLTPQLAKGLEFDLVVLVRPVALGSGTAGGVDRYVAMTRATAELVVLS